MNKVLTRALRFGLTALLVLAAALAGRHLWDYYMMEPWTRDGRVAADVIAIAPDVAGLVTAVQVRDNQVVHAGDPLFEVDTARYRAAQAQARARLTGARAQLEQARRNVARYRNLADRVVSRQKKDEVDTALETARAAVQQAQADLELAQLNLARARVVAPVDGTVSNFSLRPGNYIGAGQGVAALVDASSYYVIGYFEETKLPRIHVGDAVEVQLMGERQTLRGHVASVAAGIQDSERSGSAGNLAGVKPTFNWVRLAQRVPVRVALDRVPDDVRLVAGRSATVRVVESS